MKLPVSLTTVTLFSKILAGILFITFIISAFFIGMKYQGKIDLIAHQQANLVTAKPSPTPLVLPTIDPSITTNWKTYYYVEYNFKISYPPDWKSEINGSGDYEPGALSFTSPKDEQGNYMIFWVNRYDLAKGGFGYPPETLTAPNIMIDNIKAYQDQGYVRNPDGPSTQGISLKKDNFIYDLTFAVHKKYNLPSAYKYEDLEPAIFTSEEKKIRDNFISSFKFTDSANTTASPTPTCRPRPACLDAIPRCMIPETSEMCPRVACTMEAKLCPDGKTYVGRTGPNCEFSPCP